MNRFISTGSRTSLIFIIGILVLAPLSTYAQTTSTRATFFGPIVPLACHCDNQTVQGTGQQVSTAPDFGCVLQTIQNLINFAISIGILFVVFWMAVAGFQLIVSRGNPKAITDARARMLNAVIGIAVILSAWLIVDFVMKTIYNQNSVYGPWNAILAGGNQCLVAKNPAVISVQTVANNITSVVPGTAAGTGTQVALNGNGSGACNGAAVQSAAAQGGISMSNSEANTIACIAGPESSCGQINQNYNWNGAKSSPPSTAWGPFQITLKGNAKCLNNNACQQAAGVSGSLDCSKAFDVHGNAIPGTLLTQCQTAAASLSCSAVAADCIVQASNGSYTAWTGNADSTAKHQACVATNAGG